MAPAAPPYNDRDNKDSDLLTTGPEHLATCFATNTTTGPIANNHVDNTNNNGLDSANNANQGALVPWRNELHGPGMVVLDVDGQSRSVNDSDYYLERTRGDAAINSEAGESEGGASVFTVHDFGFDAAFQWSPANKTAGFDPDPAPPEHVLDPHELQLCLGLEPVADRSVRESISEKIMASFCSSDTGDTTSQKREYLPFNSLYDILTIETIYSLMKDNELWPNATHEELWERVREITGGRTNSKCRLRILAILILGERLKLFQAFIDNDIWDCDLPLKRSNLHSTECTTRGNAINKMLFKGCSRNDWLMFSSYQSNIHVPFFDLGENRLCSYEFDSQVTLPWQSFKKIATGGSGTVFRIEIHPSHHNYPYNYQSSERRLYFALKKCNSQERERYSKELAAHEKAHARVQKGKHLIKLLLTFQHGDDHYLMFEYADGNLEEFWERMMVRTPELPEKWATQQCFGIATALKQIHGMSTWQKDTEQPRPESLLPRLPSDRDGQNGLLPEWGRHGDLKPQNILWFSEYHDDLKDHLVVSDLGLTRYHSLLSRSNVKPNNIDGYTEAYAPPEMRFFGHYITRKADIWSLGCVYLEFCSWYLEGGEGVEKFRFDRTNEDTSDTEIKGFECDKFFNLIDQVGGPRNTSAQLKPAVETYIQELMCLADDSNSIFAKSMLEIIKDSMLLINATDRQPIDMICSEIKRVLDLIPSETEPRPPTVPRQKSSTDLPELDTKEVGSIVQHAEGNINSSTLENDVSSPIGREAVQVTRSRENVKGPAERRSSLQSSGSPFGDYREGDHNVYDSQLSSQPYNSELVESTYGLLPTQTTTLTSMDHSLVLGDKDAEASRSQEMKTKIENFDATFKLASG